MLPSYLAINACNSDFLFRPALVLQQDRQLKEADLKYKALFTAAVNQLHNNNNNNNDRLTAFDPGQPG